MGSAVGQVPEYIEMVVRWCKANTRMPVITKLTPNITDIRKPARAAQGRRHRRGVADQHHQLDHRASISTRFSPEPSIDGKGSAWRLLRPGGEADRAEHGGRDRPRSGDARPADLRHRRHHHLARRGRVHGARRRQRAGLHGGHDLRLQDRPGDDRRPRELDGREGPSPRSTRSSAAPRPTSPTGSTSTSTTSPRRASTRISASNAAAATSPARTPRTRRSRNMVDGERHFEVIEEECVGCNLCVNVCPVEDCITMEPLAVGRDGQAHRQAGVAGLRQLDDASEQPDGEGRGGVAASTTRHGRPAHTGGPIFYLGSSSNAICIARTAVPLIGREWVGS